jgi:Protein of unknown function (DUF2442)
METVLRVVPLDDYFLELWFGNDELSAGSLSANEFKAGNHRLFDAKPYLDRGVFVQLKDLTLFKQAHVALGTVCWPGNLDIAPETLFDRSQPVNRQLPIV